MIRCMAGGSTWRTLVRYNNLLRYSSSSSATPLGLSVSVTGEPNDKSGNDIVGDLPVKAEKAAELPHRDSQDRQLNKSVKKSNMVAAAFASLKVSKVPNLEKHLENADTIEAVLSISNSPTFSRQNALQVVSILADWAAKGRVKLSDFESDPRFVQICNFLGKSSQQSNDTGLGDLTTVLGVTGDDEAAKLISGISFSQQIRVMSALARKKRRSTVLLRALSTNIGNSSESLNVKEVADLLYAMALLNFPDNILLKKASVDLSLCLANNEKPAVVGSILTSLGLLRYKNNDMLDALADWVRGHHSVCRIQDLIALLLTLASVSYHPLNAHDLYKVILPAIKSEDVIKPTGWLDVIWALVVLNLIKPEQLQTVLSADFVKKLIDINRIGDDIPIASQRKLLNVNAAAKLLVKDYSGPFLPELSISKLSLKRSKEKQLLVDSVINSLKNLLPSATYLRTNVNTEYGFFIDAECAIDSKCNPLPIEEKVPKADSRRIRVAVLVCDYHDMCCGQVEFAGHVSLHVQLLKQQGYSVMVVPYTEFNPREKLVARVKYLEQRLKSLSRKIL